MIAVVVFAQTLQIFLTQITDTHTHTQRAKRWGKWCLIYAAITHVIFATTLFVEEKWRWDLMTLWNWHCKTCKAPVKQSSRNKQIHQRQINCSDELVCWAFIWQLLLPLGHQAGLRRREPSVCVWGSSILLTHCCHSSRSRPVLQSRRSGLRSEAGA